MRHGKKFNHLGRQASHRKAMLSNMSCSIIEHKRITTTVAKAKALKKYLEPLLTKAKTDSTHSRRTVFSHLNSKEAVTELYREVAPKIADRPGGYLRILRTGNRLGDNAEMCMVELVDFNTVYSNSKAGAAKKTRSRRSTTAKKAAPAADAAPVAETATDAPEAAVEETTTPVAEAPATEAPATEEENNTDETSKDKTEE
ncbi:MAG: 50S ribosomal protein L17 [Bacteroidota bacterium]